MPLAVPRLREVWQRQSLTRQFLLASAAIFVLGMALVGAWIASRIKDGVTHNTATSTALYVESFVTPLVQELAEGDLLPPHRQKSLEELIKQTTLGQRIVSIKIWRPGGLIAYASRPEQIGRKFPIGPKLKRAWDGHIAAGLDNLHEEENQDERARGQHLLEIYVPIRQYSDGRIIAVAEFYELAGNLSDDILKSILEGWLVIGSIAICAVAALFSLVGRAHRTIEHQKQDLQSRIGDLSSLLAQNQELRDQVEQSSHRLAEINEQLLRRVGAELHDGPAQLMGFALLRLDAVIGPVDATRADAAHAEIEAIRAALSESLAEMRNISAGLSLPELDGLPLKEALETAVRTHVRRTQTTVESEFGELKGKVAHSVKATAYRFIQEALNNATRHAGAAGQKVSAHSSKGDLTIEVSDSGPGLDTHVLTNSDRLGLSGLRDRVESIGGAFEIITTLGRGTQLRARLPMFAKERVVNE